MKNQTVISHIRSVIAVILLVCLTALPVFAEYPAHEDLVADAAEVLSASTIRTVKKTNESLKDADIDAVIGICTVKTTETEKISSYARNVFKEWKMTDGILLLLAVDDHNYYFIQSTGVSESLTNTVLEELRDNFFEADFAKGDYDNAVLQTVAEISDILTESSAPATDPDNDSEDGTSNDADKTEESGVGQFIVGLLKVILYLVLAVVVAFVILFVVAMFNDDAAALMQKYVFQRKKNTSRIDESYYDERLYGSPNAYDSSDRARRPRPSAEQYSGRPNPSGQRNGQYRPNPNRPTSPRGPVDPNRQPRQRTNSTYDETQHFDFPQNRH